jgi:hypothetical protein
MATLRGVLAELTQVVKDDEVRPPAWWLAKAQELNILNLDTSNQKTEAEVEFEVLVDHYESDDMSHARAVTKAKIHNSGEVYKKLKGLESTIKMVDEMGRIARRRAEQDKWEK